MTHMQKTRSEEWVVTPNLLHLCFFLSYPDIGSRLFRIKQGISAEKVHKEFTSGIPGASSSLSRCVVKGVTGTCPRDPLIVVSTIRLKNGISWKIVHEKWTFQVAFHSIFTENTVRFVTFLIKESFMS